MLYCWGRSVTNGSGNIWWLAVHTKARNWSWRVCHYPTGQLPILLQLWVDSHSLLVPGSTPSLPASNCPKPYDFLGVGWSFQRGRYCLSFLKPNTGLFRVCQSVQRSTSWLKCQSLNDRSQHHPMIRNQWSPKMIGWSIEISTSILFRESLSLLSACSCHRPQTVSDSQPGLPQLPTSMCSAGSAWFTWQSKVKLRARRRLIPEI